jgi:hypothetical protein
MSAIAERLGETGNPQELQGCQQQQECLPQSGCQQQQSQATTVTSATSNIKETAISWPLTTAEMQATAGMSATTGAPTVQHMQYERNKKQQRLQKQ